MIRLVTAGTEAFQWSTSEQEYPLEKFSDGSTLYAKQVNFGNLPSSGTKYVAHNIAGFNSDNLVRYEVLASDPDVSGTDYVAFNLVAGSSDAYTVLTADGRIRISTNASWWSRLTATVRLIYKK